MAWNTSGNWGFFTPKSMELWAPTSIWFSGAHVGIRLAIFLGAYVRWFARTMDATSGLRSPKIRDYETCKVHPRKLMMTMEKQPFEDVWSYEKHGDFPAIVIVMLVFRTWGFITLLSTGFMRPILLVTPPRMLARHYQADITFFC